MTTLLLAIFPFHLSCGGPPGSVAGAWNGQWASSVNDRSGTIFLRVKQNGSTVTGTVANGPDVVYGVATDFNGTFTASDGKWLGSVGRVTYDLQVTGASASGSYSRPASPPIDGLVFEHADFGIITLTYY